MPSLCDLAAQHPPVLKGGEPRCLGCPVGASLDSVPEGLSAVLGTQHVLNMKRVCGWMAAGDCKKTLALEAGVLGLEGQLDSLAL